MRRVRIVIAVALLAVTYLAMSGVAGDRVNVGTVSVEKDRPALTAVDHSQFDALLKKYVDDRGRVAYAKWNAAAGDVKHLDEYLALLSNVNLKEPATKEAKLAFWINAYNAVTIKGILREYPTTSIRNHTAKVLGYNIWKDLHLAVDDSTMSLDDIEHKVLRKLGEPRIHFAIVCASIGCPPLRCGAYTADKLNEQLDASAKKFWFFASYGG